MPDDVNHVRLVMTVKENVKCYDGEHVVFVTDDVHQTARLYYTVSALKRWGHFIPGSKVVVEINLTASSEAS